MAYSGPERHYGRDSGAVGLYFDLVTATALINFGALVAFTFVNLSVYNHFWRRKGLNKTWKDRFHYLLLPLIGAVTVGVLWINLEATS